MTAPLDRSADDLAREDEAREELRQRRATRGRLAATLAVVGLATVTLASSATGAFFTDTQSVGGNAFTTGTVRLAATPASTAISSSNMAPGDQVVAPLTVSNTGTLAQRYAVLSTTDAADANFLAAQLSTTVKTGVTSCTATGFAATGTIVYGPGALGSVAGTKLVGDAASGAQAGDRVLAAGANETLCVRVSLPTTTDNTYQGKTATAVLRFDAEQTANNP